VFLLVPAYLGSRGQKAVKRLCLCVCIEFCAKADFVVVLLCSFAFSAFMFCVDLLIVRLCFMSDILFY